VPIEDYYEPFYLQKCIPQATGFPPPSNYENIWEDGLKIMGVFILDSSSRIMTASAEDLMTRGRFSVSTDTELNDGDIVKRVKDGLFIKVVGHAKVSPLQAESQIRLYAGEIVEGMG
jgi:hypothetical protein